MCIRDRAWAAVEAHLGGADGITVHLREDRRHIQDADVEKLRTLTQIKLNLEMAATDEMVEIACRLKPEMAMLVPEGRHEVTTEGGLDIVSQETKLKKAIDRFSDAGIISSVFIDAEPVSYTHLDVYKRQAYINWHYLFQWGIFCALVKVN